MLWCAEVSTADKCGAHTIFAFTGLVIRAWGLCEKTAQSPEVDLRWFGAARPQL